MKYIWITLLLISSLIGGELNFMDDYELSLKMAKKQDKHLYVLVTSSSCRWCRKFEKTTLKDDEVLEMLDKKYVVAHLDRDMDDMPEWFDASRVPKHYFVTADGKEIFSFLGYWGSLDFKSYLGDIDKKYKEKVAKGELK